MFDLGIISSLVKTIAAPIVGHFQQKAAVKAAKVESEIRVIEAKTKHIQQLVADRQAADIQWEIKSIENSGWKDEYLLVLFSIPLVMCFIPGLDVYVVAGFNALQGTPEWYQWAICIMVGSAYGVKKFADGWMRKKG
jgi:hypothetical protein